MNYHLKPKTIALFLGGLATYLALQSLIGEYLLENVLLGESDSAVIFLIDLLSVNVEESIPTWYSTLLLFLASALLFFIWGVKKRQQDRLTTYWLGLAATFLYLSMDEGAAIHETVVEPLERIFDTSGYLAFSWQIVFLPLAILFALIYVRFLWQLPIRTRNLIMLSGVIYVGGAIFIEGISANEWYLNNGITFSYLAIATLEEWCEMVGATLFIYTLLDYIVAGRYTAVFHFIPDLQNRPNLNLQPLLKGGLLFVLLLNVVLFSWVFNQQPILALAGAEERPFYETIATEYATENVVILQFNTMIDGERSAALLTLFDDVLVVAELENQQTFVFASQQLPFTKQQLQTRLDGANAPNSIILDQSDLTQLANE